MGQKDIWSYLGKFSLVYIILYFIMGAAFLIFQSSLPASERVALDFFQPYNQITWINFFIQLIKTILIGLLLFPFYNIIFKTRYGFLIIFGALWGLRLLGSVEPIPGSIEGLIYTKTTMVEHAVVLVAKSFQYLIFSWLIYNWERVSTKKIYKSKIKYLSNWRYIGFFILFHVVTYVICGIIFMKLQNYEEGFATMESFSLYRDLDHPLVAATIPMQILRGSILALFLSPFYKLCVKKQNNWGLFFLVIYGFTFFVEWIPGLINDIVAAEVSFVEITLGSLEVTFQMFIFSWLLFKWKGGVNHDGICLN